MQYPSSSRGVWAAVVVCVWAVGQVGCVGSSATPTLRVFRTVGDTGSVQRIATAEADVARRQAPTNLVVLIPHDAARPSLPGAPALPTAELAEGDPLSLAEGLAVKTAIFRRTGLTDPQLRVVVLDWAAEPATPATARARVLAAADELFRLLSQGGHLDAEPARQHLHVIGHGRGGAVASLLARRLAELGRPIGHLTLLDAFDAVSSHQALQDADEPPLAPELADWSDNYFSDGFFAGVGSGDNFFASGRRVRGAGVNVHFSGLVGLTALDQYRRSIADASCLWGWNWSRLGADWQPTRAVAGTIELDAPRVRLEGRIAQLAAVEHELLFAPAGQPESAFRLVRYDPSGPAAKILQPGRYLLRVRDRGTGRALPLLHTVVEHRFDAGPSRDARRAVPPTAGRADLGHVFEVAEGTVGVEHLFRLAELKP